ncbi:UNVERIFIED_CONTAM: hypothetical protein FKN15_008809 [Acipenser sinensis]
MQQQQKRRQEGRQESRQGKERSNRETDEVRIGSRKQEEAAWEILFLDLDLAGEVGSHFPGESMQQKGMNKMAHTRTLLKDIGSGVDGHRIKECVNPGNATLVAECFEALYGKQSENYNGTQ